MAELRSEERLQPALLDRLLDQDPAQKIESRDRRVISMQRLKECVRRDLAWLLGAGRLETLVDLEAFDAVRESVLNYGIPDIAGMSIAGADSRTIEDAVRAAILKFEPRLLPSSLKVTLNLDRSSMQSNAMLFRIEADIWGDPVPQEVLWSSKIDLETGSVEISEEGA